MVYVYKLKGGVPLTAFDGCAMVAATSTHHFATILLQRQSWQVRVRLYCDTKCDIDSKELSPDILIIATKTCRIYNLNPAYYSLKNRRLTLVKLDSFLLGVKNKCTVEIDQQTSI